MVVDKFYVYRSSKDILAPAMLNSLKVCNILKLWTNNYDFSQKKLTPIKVH